jgi:uncharacterized membrane protein/nitrite reductase/ring-hydroxylating ferredoxin subunit
MQYVKAILQGRPFGTPLHAIVIHFPIGLFLLAVIFDLWNVLFDGGNQAVRAAFAAIVFGLVTALVAAVPGFADWWDIRKDSPAKRTATIHMILNLTAVALFLVSAALRVSERDADEVPTLAFILGLVAFAALGYSGYLGGTLVYASGVGVGRHRRPTDTPKQTISASAQGLAAGQYVPVASDDQLGEGETLRVDFDGTIVTIARSSATLYAVQEFCTHRFGPLSEGKVQNGQIECPWHRSCFDLRTGSVTNGPAKVDLRTFDVIALDGTIYLREAEDGRREAAPRGREERPPQVAAITDDVWQTIKPGDQLVSAKGMAAGRVVAVLPDKPAVTQGDLRPTVSYVPRSVVVGRDGDRIHLDIAADQVHYRWG